MGAVSIQSRPSSPPHSYHCPILFFCAVYLCRYLPCCTCQSASMDAGSDSHSSPGTLVDSERRNSRSSPPKMVNGDGKDYTLPKRPWRKHITQWSAIVEHPYKGNGTEESPFLVEWLPDDPEDPMRWEDVYKWTVVVTAAITTLAITMASSTL